jgi:hypothetical protein
MAEVETLSIPPALYDFVLYYECASKDWLSYSKKNLISGDGSLRDAIKWDSKYSYDPNDKGGRTLFGVTESTWRAYVESCPDKNYSKDLNTMGKQGWHDQIDWFWITYSNAGKSANYACAFIIFQMAWGGFNNSALVNIINTLKNNADKKDYFFITDGDNYKKLADATHAYTDPMIAYDYMRKGLSQYYYNISNPNNSNKIYRNGWLTRSALSFTPYGLYIPTTISYKNVGLKYESTIEQWESVALQLAQNNTSGYVKIIDWGTQPESVEKMISNDIYNYTPVVKTNFLKSSINSSSGAYGGCGGVYQLGNYTITPDIQVIKQQDKRRDEVLNTLIEGSYIPNDIKKCGELTTSDKKKGIK